MQGGIEEETPKISIYERINKIYLEREDFANFINFTNAAIPASLDDAVTKAKKIIPRFLFYYMCFLAIVDFFFVIAKRCLFIPIIITAAFACIYVNPITIKEVTITPMYSVISCAIINILLLVLFRPLAMAYVSFIALNAVCLLLIFFHSTVVFTESDDDVEKV